MRTSAPRTNRRAEKITQRAGRGVVWNVAAAVRTVANALANAGITGVNDCRWGGPRWSLRKVDGLKTAPR